MATDRPTVAYREPFRPQYHFSPPAQWMNDPNGLVYLDGEYHLFYQHNPFGPNWGHTSWGHAVSSDLVHWEHLPVALPEEDGVMIYSGSAVFDGNDTSGLGTTGRPPLVAVYTGHRVADGVQSQCLAHSVDGGRCWTKYPGNPVLDLGLTDFRDPKVLWYEPGRCWIMAVALSALRKIRFYASPDLKRWTFLSDFGPAGATEGPWECPDLFPLRVDDEPGAVKWVLQVDVNEGAPAGGSGGQYFLGRFDGSRFVADDARTRWIDYGKDCYATLSWSGIPEHDGRRIWIAWMSNWSYAASLPTSPWRGALTLPRVVELRSFGDGPFLVQRPVEELRRLRTACHRLVDAPLDGGERSLSQVGIRGRSLEIRVSFEPRGARVFGLKVHRGQEEETVVGCDVAAGAVFVDRRRSSGQVDFHPRFPARTRGPLRARGERVTLHVFVDWSSVEVFADEGRTVLTNLVFPDASSDGVALFAEGGSARVVSLEAWPLGSAWMRPA